MRRVQFPPRAVGQGPSYLGSEHFGRLGTIFADKPCAMPARVGEAEVVELILHIGIVRFLNIAIFDVFRPSCAVRHAKFIQCKQNEAGNESNDKIRYAQSPQTHACGAHGGDFVVSRMVRECVERREQQRDGQHCYQTIWYPCDTQFDDIQQVQFGFL